jgi:DNA-binding transcriptional ArsR family regulator
MKAEAAIFRALADPTRRQILCELADSELAAGEIAARFDISGPSISRHLAILKNADLVSERREANRIIYRLEPDHLAISMSNFLGTVCPQQMVLRRKIAKRATG